MKFILLISLTLSIQSFGQKLKDTVLYSGGHAASGFKLYLYPDGTYLDYIWRDSFPAKQIRGTFTLNKKLLIRQRQSHSTISPSHLNPKDTLTVPSNWTDTLTVRNYRRYEYLLFDEVAFDNVRKDFKKTHSKASKNVLDWQFYRRRKSTPIRNLWMR